MGKNEKKALMIVVAIEMLMIAITGVLVYKTNSPSEAVQVVSEEETWYKYYTSYYVQEGDTLWSIADDYLDEGENYTRETWIKEVRQMNGLDWECHIRTGQHLSVPYYSKEYKP